ncbi:MAG: hypothetical protein ACP5HU_10285 [Phycisphaerae bacterium]
MSVPTRRLVLAMVGFVLLAACLGGCRAHPGSLATLVAGDAINDADVRGKRDKLIGKPIAAADEMFAPRLETLDDMDRPGVSIVFYPTDLDLLNKSRYTVETVDGVIEVVAKIKRNIDGIEDMIHAANLREDLIGKSPAECSQDEDLGQPIRTLRSRETDEIVRFYDVRHWSDFLKARYCVLRFQDEKCSDVTLYGVSAATMKDPVRRQPGESD